MDEPEHTLEMSTCHKHHERNNPISSPDAIATHQKWYPTKKLSVVMPYTPLTALPPTPINHDAASTPHPFLPLRQTHVPNRDPFVVSQIIETPKAIMKRNTTAPTITPEGGLCTIPHPTRHTRNKPPSRLPSTPSRILTISLHQEEQLRPPSFKYVIGALC